MSEKPPSPVAPTSPPRLQRATVLVAIDAGRGYARETISGVIDYARRHTAWSFAPVEHVRGRVIEPHWLAEADGVLMLESGEAAERVRAGGTPSVGLWDPGSRGCVRLDHAAVADLAIDHFVNLGLRSFATFTTGGRGHDRRLDAFRRRVHDRGHTLHEKVVTRPDPAADGVRDIRERWGGWLRSLPVPVGILCSNTRYAQQLLFAADLERIAVPEQVAVLAAGTDDLACEMCRPPLSTVDTGSHRCGYEMARLLHRHLLDPSLGYEEVTVPPRGVVTRRSTQMLAIEDAGLARALRHIREHACEQQRIADLLAPLPMSRRAVEMGIRRELGRTVGEEVTRLRIERVKQLLAFSTMPLPDVAARSGFAYPSHLSRVFKQRTGQTPTQYRRSVAGDV